MTNIDAHLVAWGIDPKYMSENEKIGKIYDKGFDNGLRFALNKALEILDDVSSKSSMGGEYWNSAKTITVLRRRIMALKEGEQE